MAAIDLNLPTEAVDWPVALDTEASGLFVDDGARVAVVSCAWRQAGEIESRVYAFDQGPDTWLGLKTGLPRRYPGPSLFDQDAINLGLDEWHAMGDWLRRQALIYHNSKYDQHILRTGLRGLEATTGLYLGRSYHWDTMVVAPLLWPNESVALKSIAQREWGEQERAAEVEMRGWLKHYCGKRDDYRFDLAPWQIMEPYARHDPVLTLRLYELQKTMILLGEVYRGAPIDQEIDLAQVLYRMEARGVGYDVAAAKVAHEQLRLMISNAHDDLRSATGLETHTEARMRQYWFFEQGHEITKRTDAGQASVSADVVRELVAKGARGAAEYQALTKLETAESMWYGNWYRLVGPDGRIRTSYHQTKSQDERRKDRGTVSGRLAVERWQAQAIPHDDQLPPGLPSVRSFLQPKPGYVLVECDMNQAEMRMAAGLTRCRAMIDVFLQGDDAHSMTARHTFQVDESAPNWRYLRAVAKRLNFGLIYGAGEGTIRDQIILWTGTFPEPEDVHEWMVDFKTAFPELDRGSRAAIRFAEARGFVEMPGGRRRYFAFGEQMHKAFNARIQGGVSQCMAGAMIDIEAEMPGYQLLQTHDSIMFEVPHSDEGRDIIKRSKVLMQRAFEARVDAPFTVDTKVLASAAVG